MDRLKIQVKNSLRGVVFGWFLILLGLLGGMVPLVWGDEASAIGQNESTSTGVTENESADENSTEEKNETDGNGCEDALGGLAWIVCPTTDGVAEGVDALYGWIEKFLTINPIEMKDGAPIYEIWKYCLSVSNIVFVIFLLVVIYSQITGLGISNYGIKRALPKLIVVAVFVNLSFLICSLAVEVSNVMGHGLTGLFDAVAESAAENIDVDEESLQQQVITAGAATIFPAILTGAVAIETGAVWLLIPVVLGAAVSVLVGFFTIALRQAVVIILVMVAPIAMIAQILPNTEQWFRRWKQYFVQMLVFYPMFSLLFGASNVAGFAIMMSGDSVFWILLGLAVQIFPLIMAVKMMKMSGTFMGTVGAKLHGLAARPLAYNRAWAGSHRMNRTANFVKNNRMPSAKLINFMEKRKRLRGIDTDNAMHVIGGRAMTYAQKTIGSGIEIGDGTSRKKSNRYTRTAKAAKNHDMIAGNAMANTAHALGNYNSYYKGRKKDKALGNQGAAAFLDYGRARYVAEIDDENDTKFLVDTYWKANELNADGTPKDEVAYARFIRSVAGADGVERTLGKIRRQQVMVESKQRAEAAGLLDKYGYNAYNKKELRNWIKGYLTDDDGWAVDENGEKLRDDDGNRLEITKGDILTRAPEKLVLYDKRDELGLYCDLRDQHGNIVTRLHRGKDANGVSHDNIAFIKEVLANYDIPIGDAVNDVYNILSGIKVGDIVTPQGRNEIGLAAYSTTIRKAMSSYKDNAAWAGAMFNSMVGNRQIKNAAQHALAVCDSLKKTGRPGSFNTQNPASLEFLNTLLNPKNWDKIFTEEALEGAVNINNEEIGGEDWEYENGVLMREPNGEIKHTSVENPTYEQKMNTIKRKYLFPVLSMMIASADRLGTSNTADRQKPKTANAMADMLDMIEKEYVDNPVMKAQFDPLLVRQDLRNQAMEFKSRKYDKDGNLLYARQRNGNSGAAARTTSQSNSMLLQLEDAYNRAMNADILRSDLAAMLASREDYQRALQRFEELCALQPEATMGEMRGWFEELAILTNYD